MTEKDITVISLAPLPKLSDDTIVQHPSSRSNPWVKDDTFKVGVKVEKVILKKQILVLLQSYAADCRADQVAPVIAEPRLSTDSWTGEGSFTAVERTPNDIPTLYFCNSHLYMK